jgi:hypothetical protein
MPEDFENVHHRTTFGLMLLNLAQRRLAIAWRFIRGGAPSGFPLIRRLRQRERGVLAEDPAAPPDQARVGLSGT